MTVPARRKAQIGAAVVLHRLRALTSTTPAIEQLIEGLSDVQAYRAGGDLSPERAPTMRPRYLISGWAAKVRWLPDGRRQIFNFVVPGESVGVCLRPNPLALSTTIALTQVEMLDAGPVQRAIAGDDPVWNELRDAIHISASYDEAYMLNQVLRLGRQTAYERICHLLLELHERLTASGLAQETQFAMPLTQEVLADSTGLSVVHVNRILQQLRRERLLELQTGRVRFLDRAALEAIADYRRPSPVAVPTLGRPA
jgi:CRP-like cAMP-binding protein